MGRLRKGLNLKERADQSKFIKRLNEQFKQLGKYETPERGIFDSIRTALALEFGDRVPVGERVSEKSGERYIVLPNTKQTQALASTIEKILNRIGYKTAAERHKEARKQAKKVKQETKDKRSISQIIKDLKVRAKLFEFITENGDFAYKPNGEMHDDVKELTGGEDYSKLTTRDLRKLRKQIEQHKAELLTETADTIQKKTGYNIMQEEWTKP